jgi:hypothetical protein
MYNVVRQTHEKYGNVIEITKEEIGEFETPFRAVNRALTIRRQWIDSTSKVRLLVDGQVVTPNGAEHWANEEYRSLPKCEACAKILGGDVYTHQLCGSNLFCSQPCADKDYAFQVEKMNDEEECDYL